MKIIVPFNVTSFTTNVPDSALPEWNSGTAYNPGDQVQISADNDEYECLIANTNQDPSTNPIEGVSGNPYWLPLGKENKWKVFDKKTGSKTTNLESIVYTIIPGEIINSIALFGTKAVTVNVTVNSPSQNPTEVYNSDVSQVDVSEINDFYDWHFVGPLEVTRGVLLDLPPYPDAEIAITLTEETGVVAELGEIVIGILKDLGTTTYGTSLTGDDFSIKATDPFGNTELEVGNIVEGIDYQVAVPANRTASMKNTLKEIRATPTVYIGSPDKPETIIYGFWEQYRPVLSTPGRTELVLNVQELA